MAGGLDAQKLQMLTQGGADGHGLQPTALGNVGQGVGMGMQACRAPRSSVSWASA